MYGVFGGRGGLAFQPACPHEIGHATSRLRDHEFPDSRLAPAARAQQRGVLAAQYYRARRLIEYRDRAKERERIADGAQQLLMGPMVPHLQHRARGDQRDRAVSRPETALDVPWFPRMVFLVFGDAAGVLSGRAHRCAVRYPRRVTEAVQQQQPDGAADRGVGTHAGTEYVVAGIDPELG